MAQRQAVQSLLLTFGVAMSWSCAPMMSSPPSTPMRSAEYGEINHGIQAGVGKGGEPSKQGEMVRIEPMANYHLALRKPFNGTTDREIGTLITAGYPSMVAVGAYYRAKLLGGEKTYIGGQAALGWLWGGVALPMAFKVGENTWFTTQPSMSVGAYAFQFTRVPLGMGWELGEYNRFDAEIGGTIEGKSDSPGLGDDYHGYVGVHFSRQMVPKKLRKADPGE